jgi:hypothetical protein
MHFEQQPPPDCRITHSHMYIECERERGEHVTGDNISNESNEGDVVNWILGTPVHSVAAPLVWLRLLLIVPDMARPFPFCCSVPTKHLFDHFRTTMSSSDSPCCGRRMAYSVARSLDETGPRYRAGISAWAPLVCRARRQNSS